MLNGEHGVYGPDPQVWCRRDGVCAQAHGDRARRKKQVHFYTKSCTPTALSAFLSDNVQGSDSNVHRLAAGGVNRNRRQEPLNKKPNSTSEQCNICRRSLKGEVTALNGTHYITSGACC